MTWRTVEKTTDWKSRAYTGWAISILLSLEREEKHRFLSED